MTGTNETIATLASHKNDLGWTSVIPLYDPVRNDPGFVEIMRGMSLPTT